MLAAGDTIKQTQSAVVLESLISQFLFNKAADAGRGAGAGGAGQRRRRSDDATGRRAAASGAGRSRSLSRLRGCATIREARGGPGQRLDPWENWNRKVFNFNEDLDNAVLKPVATAYTEVVPQAVRRGVSNFFANFADAWSAVNNLLQGKFAARLRGRDPRQHQHRCSACSAFSTSPREMGLEHHYEDFGQTLGRWGVGAGAYVVLPLLGPSTVRDTAALPLDRLASPPAFVDGTGDGRSASRVLQLVNTRASLLGATRVIDDIALDKYTFIRDAYLQRRRSLVFDGDVPETPAAPEDAASAAAGRGGRHRRRRRRRRPRRRHRRVPASAPS